MVSNAKMVSNMVSSTKTDLEYGLERLEVSSLEVSSKLVSSLGLEQVGLGLGLEVSVSSRYPWPANDCFWVMKPNCCDKLIK